MSVDPEAVRKILVEIEEKASSCRQQLNSVQAQTASKNKQARLLELTQKEIKALTPETNVYEGMGKMFVVADKESVLKRLSDEEKANKSDIESLGKRQHYLETTLKNTESTMKQFLGR